MQVEIDKKEGSRLAPLLYVAMIEEKSRG
jgi:hypothetical protein